MIKNEKYDRLSVETRITFNKPVTQKQMEKVLQILNNSFENSILESEKLTAQIGHVITFNPFNEKEPFEICI